MSHWEEKNVLVTGATGLVGSWLVPELVKNGANVTMLMRDRVTNSLGASIVHGSLEDYSIVERALNEYEIDTVFHLGAQAIVPIANRSPISTFKSNIEGTWNVLEACRRIDTASKIIVASSDKAYGHADLPYTESTRLEGRHPYDVSKSCADLICQSYFDTYGLPVNITRCGNIYGGGDTNWSRIIPGTIRSILRGERPTIRSNGKYIRDYIYIKDIVSAYMLLSENNFSGEVFNFSNEDPRDVMSVVERILVCMKCNLNPKILDNGKNEIEDQYLSSKKARIWLNWEPKYNFDSGIKETISWYKNHLKI